MPACLPECVRACLPACLFAYLPIFVPFEAYTLLCCAGPMYIKELKKFVLCYIILFSNCFVAVVGLYDMSWGAEMVSWLLIIVLSYPLGHLSHILYKGSFQVRGGGDFLK